MSFDRLKEKLNILADAAKYDVSCSSSGSNRTNKNKGLGNASASGICHTYTEDGRCVSLLKILLTNRCKGKTTHNPNSSIHRAQLALDYIASCIRSESIFSPAQCKQAETIHCLID